MSDPTAATADLLRIVRNLVQPPIYYADREELPRGQVLYYDPSKVKFGYAHPYFVLHPDDLAELQAQLPGARFVHLRDAPHAPDDFLWPPFDGGSLRKEPNE